MTMTWRMEEWRTRPAPRRRMLDVLLFIMQFVLPLCAVWYNVLKLFKVPIDLYLSMLTIYKPDIEYVDIVDRLLFAKVKVLMLIKNYLISKPSWFLLQHHHPVLTYVSSINKPITIKSTSLIFIIGDINGNANKDRLCYFLTKLMASILFDRNGHLSHQSPSK